MSDRISLYEQIKRIIESSYETRESGFKMLPDGKYLGYRVSRYLWNRAVSGADSSQSNGINAGDEIVFKGKGAFLINDPEYAMNYYGVHDEGQNILQMVEFDAKDVTSGSLYDREPEITVKRAIVLKSKIF